MSSTSSTRQDALRRTLSEEKEGLTTCDSKRRGFCWYKYPPVYYIIVHVIGPRQTSHIAEAFLDNYFMLGTAVCYDNSVMGVEYAKSDRTCIAIDKREWKIWECPA